MALWQHNQWSTSRIPSGPSAQANLGKIPDELSDEQVVLLADIASTGFSGAESGQIRIGDSVVVFAQGPIGLCATAGAKLIGATMVIGIDGDDARLAMSRRMGADVALELFGSRGDGVLKVAIKP